MSVALADKTELRIALKHLAIIEIHKIVHLTLQGYSLMVELQNLYSLVLKHIRSYLELIESIYRTLVFLPKETIYLGTLKHYSVEKVLYKCILSEHRESGSHS